VYLAEHNSINKIMKKLSAIVFTFLFCTSQLIGQISLVKDINKTPTGSMPPRYYKRGFFESINDKVVCITQDNAGQNKLTSVDSTNHNYAFIKSLSRPEQQNFQLTKFNGFLYFLDYGNNGTELWKTDGTIQGTIKIKDNLGQFSEIIVYQGFMYFVGYNSIWKSDGTTNGTISIFISNDIYVSNTINSYGVYLKNQNLLAFNNHLIYRKNDLNLYKLNLQSLSESSLVSTPYYSGDLPQISSNIDCDTSMYFTERRNNISYIWKIKQNNFQTTVIDSLQSSFTQELFKVNNRVMYLSDTKLFSIHATTGNRPVILKDTLSNLPYYSTNLFAISFSVVFNNKFYFISSGRNSGYKLWESDGTNNGTIAIKELPSKPSAIFKMDNFIYFKLFNENRLWKSDGTASNTTTSVDLQNIKIDTLLNFENQFYALNHKAYFWGYKNEIGAEPYSTDGNTSVNLLADIGQGTNSAYPDLAQSVKIDGTLYFLADNGINFGNKLWKSDGTESGTRLVKRISSTYYDNISNLTSMNGILYFTASDDINGIELWRSDGSELGTYMVKNINPTPFAGSQPSNLTVFKGFLYFAARDGTSNSDLWKSDGTEAGTIKFSQSLFYSSANNLFATKDNLFFVYEGFSQSVLWVTDGTIAGTHSLRNSDVNTSGLQIFNPTCFAQINNKVYFFSLYRTNTFYYNPHEALFESDGTDNGTKIVKDFGEYGGVDSLALAGSNSLFLTTANQKLFFHIRSQSPGSTGYEYHLWTSNGTSAETKLVSAATKNLFGYYSIASVNNDIYYLFNKDYDGRNAELWKFDGSTNVKVKDFSNYYRGSSQWVTFENKLYLTNTPVGTDSTSVFTVSGTSIDEYYKSSQLISHIVEMDGNFYFNSFTPDYGYEMWKTSFCYYVTSKQSGNWDDSSTWTCNTVPTLYDTVLIKPSHIIDVNSGEKKIKKLILRGQLNIRSKVSIQE
jgi:trimeric autotransporter adhesin